MIGGTSLFGGRGAIVGTMLGALIVYVFELGSAWPAWTPSSGCSRSVVLIIVAVSLDQWIRKVKA